ncbi:MAG: hypothetical protein ILO68_00680 [Clostridia bacterium]|nr:hypothetical protein [Clostridia bacterium]
MKRSFSKAVSALLLTALLVLLAAAAGCGLLPSPSGESSFTEPASGSEPQDLSSSVPEPESAPPAELSPEPAPSEPDETSDPASEAGESAESEESEPEEGTVLVRSLTLPDSSASDSSTLAAQLLGFCSGGTADVTSYVLEQAGFEIVLKSGYDKLSTDDSHTCAFMIGEGTVLCRGMLRPVFLISIRGTSGAEWDSNFDFAPSHSDDTAYAENFLACAEDVYKKAEPLLRAKENPVIAVCGHSRGAACANLLGVLLNRSFPTENTYVYTFATPETVRPSAGFDNTPHRNIFNYINPCDIVTRVPLEAWGFRRAGTDILLEADAEQTARVNASVKALEPAAPTISAYYETKYPLSSKGKSDKMTTFEVMKLVSVTLRSMSAETPEALKKVDSDSVFYSVVTFFTGTTGSGLSLPVLLQHMPATYMLKIQTLPETVTGN